MLKKLTLFQLLLFHLLNSNAQEASNVKLEIGVGFPIGTSSDNFGILAHMEPKLKVSNKAFIGMRMAIAINSQTLENQNSNKFMIDEEFDHGFFSVVPTLDYYWQKERFLPFLGLGIGAYSIGNYLDVSRIGAANPNDRQFEVEVGYQIGLLLRGGIESKKVRLSMEYNFVPQTTIESPEGEKVGTVNSSYLGITFGLIIGPWKV